MFRGAKPIRIQPIIHKLLKECNKKHKIEIGPELVFRLLPTEVVHYNMLPLTLPCCGDPTPCCGELTTFSEPGNGKKKIKTQNTYDNPYKNTYSPQGEYHRGIGRAI